MTRNTCRSRWWWCHIDDAHSVTVSVRC